MTHVLWTALATRDRQQVQSTGSSERDIAAMEQRLAQQVAVLVRHPRLGRRGRIPGTREWVIERDHVLVYEAWRDAIVILRLLHARQRWPAPPCD